MRGREEAESADFQATSKRSDSGSVCRPTDRDTALSAESIVLCLTGVLLCVRTVRTESQPPNEPDMARGIKTNRKAFHRSLQAKKLQHRSLDSAGKLLYNAP